MRPRTSARPVRVAVGMLRGKNFARADSQCQDLKANRRESRTGYRPALSENMHH